MKNRYPFSAFPNSWFVVACSSELAVGQVQPLYRFGKHLVLFRTESGAARLFDAYCPHMGSHLGHGGQVEGETLICPAHRRRYDVCGTCVEVPTNPRGLPQPGLHSWPVREVHGFILAYHHEEGLPPAWEVPSLPGWREDEWTPMRHGQQPKCNANVWEMAADVADVNHFRYLHGFQDARFTDVAVEGASFRCTLHFKADSSTVGGISGSTLDVKVDQALLGLGLQVFKTAIDFGGGSTAETMLITASTPIDDETVDIRWAACAKKLAHEQVTRMVEESFVASLMKGYDDDRYIHETRIYLSRPALCSGDGPIGRYRSWTHQFYSDVTPFQRDSPLLARRHTSAA